MKIAYAKLLLFIGSLICLSNASANDQTTCEIIMEGPSATLIGSKVALMKGQDISVAIFLGKQRKGNGQPVYYFLDPEKHFLFWSLDEDLRWTSDSEPKLIQVERQMGQTCYAYSLVNCVEYFQPLPARDQEAFLRAAITFTTQASTAKQQDERALLLLKLAGVPARLTQGKKEILNHIQNGLPAILGVNVRSVAAENVFSQQGVSPYLNTHVYSPAPTRDFPHAVVAIGRILIEKLDYLIILEPRSGEITAWKTESVMRGLSSQQILVGVLP